mmetsp:Transcript_3410/g.7103  ORF Transcript_3410/g.7103 Transcript_3410/m.7103 type:complete len:84 (-) Transcript_3410:727-978(-)
MGKTRMISIRRLRRRSVLSGSFRTLMVVKYVAVDATVAVVPYGHEITMWTARSLDSSNSIPFCQDDSHKNGTTLDLIRNQQGS